MYSPRNVSHSHLTCIDNHRIIWTFVLILAVVLLFARNHPLASLYPAYSFFLWVSSVAIFRVYDMTRNMIFVPRFCRLPNVRSFSLYLGVSVWGRNVCFVHPPPPYAPSES